MATRDQITGDIFSSIVTNAIDFLFQSVRALEEDPKQSLINFYTAVELFVKARLMREHWSLVYSQPHKATLRSFLEGDLVSVGLDEARTRLANIAGVTIPSAAYDTFDELRQERNRLIHFFNPGYRRTSELNDVTASQYKGWYYLHKLLTENWREPFKDYLHLFEQMDQAMHSQHSFLQAKYESLQQALEKGREGGTTFFRCGVCNFPAVREIAQTDIESVVSVGCLVCTHETWGLNIQCPECATMCLYALGEGICDQCGFRFRLDDILQFFTPDPDWLQVELAYCATCEYSAEPTVIVYAGQWLCLFCLNTHDYPDHCGWCGEFVTGDAFGNYHSPGCFMCGVHIARDAYDDDDYVMPNYRDRTVLSKDESLRQLEDQIKKYLKPQGDHELN